MSEFQQLRELLDTIGAEYQVPVDDDHRFQMQLAGGAAPRRTRTAIRLCTTWFYFDRDGQFLGYGYAGYDEEEHFTSRVVTERAAKDQR